MIGQMFSTLNRREKKEGEKGRGERKEGRKRGFPFSVVCTLVYYRIGQTKARQDTVRIYVHFVSLLMRGDTLLRELCIRQ